MEAVAVAEVLSADPVGTAIIMPPAVLPSSKVISSCLANLPAILSEQIKYVPRIAAPPLSFITALATTEVPLCTPTLPLAALVGR